LHWNKLAASQADFAAMLDTRKLRAGLGIPGTVNSSELPIPNGWK